MQEYVPDSIATIENIVLKSRFIATGGPAFSVDEARLFIASVKSKYPDATHNVPAFVVGSGNSVISHSSDDGEPSGTAGRPVLAVLSGSIFTNTVIVITRYFGGVKLGTGGLVKAYSEAARALLNILPKAQAVLVSELEIVLSYNFYDRFQIVCRNYEANILKTDFGTDILSLVQIPDKLRDSFVNELTDFSSGNILINPIEVAKTVLLRR